MHNERFQLSRKITTQLLHWTQVSPTQEICGLIGAKNNIACSCYPIDNVAKHAENRFYMDTKQQIATLSAIRDKNETLFAIYHSHPTTPAIPSATDITLATYPNALYLIISLHIKGILEIHGFKIQHKVVKNITLTLTE